MSDTDAAVALADGEPPGLDEPLVKLHSTGVQSAIAWVHNVVTSLAANLEAEREQHALTEKELRADDRQLRERLEILEQCISSSPLKARSLAPMTPHGGSGTTASVDDQFSRVDSALDDVSKRLNSLEVGMGPADGAAGREFLMEQQQLADRMQRLEQHTETLREQSMHKLKAQDELIAMRLETIEVELTSCLRAKDLDSLRNQVDSLKISVGKEGNADTWRNLEQELKGELHSRAVTLQKDLQTITEAVNDKLSLFEEQLEQLEAMSPGVEGALAIDSKDAEGGSSVGTVKLNKQVKDLDRRVEDLAESQRLLRDLLDRSVPLGTPIRGSTEERRLSNQSLQIAGGDLLQGFGAGSTRGGASSKETSPPNTAGQAPRAGRELSPSNAAGSRLGESSGGLGAGANVDDSSLVPGQEQMAKLAEQVEQKLDRFAQRISALETGASRPVSATASLTTDMTELKDLASRVDRALDIMSSRITALESGGLAPAAFAEAPMTAASSATEQAAARGLPEALETGALTSAPSQDSGVHSVTTAVSPNPGIQGQQALPQLAEFASRMDRALGDVSTRIGKLEEAQGQLEKEVVAVRSRPTSANEPVQGEHLDPTRVVDAPGPLMEYAAQVDRALEKMSQRIAELERERRAMSMQQASEERGSSGMAPSQLTHAVDEGAAATQRSLPRQLEHEGDHQQPPGSRLAGDVANHRLDQIEANLSRCVRPEHLDDWKQQVLQEVQLASTGPAGASSVDANGLPSSAVVQRDLPSALAPLDCSAAPANSVASRPSSAKGGGKLEMRVSRLESDLRELLNSALAGLEAPQSQNTSGTAKPSAVSGTAGGPNSRRASGASAAGAAAAGAARGDPLAAVEQRVHQLADQERATEFADLAKRVEELTRRVDEGGAPSVHLRESQQHELESWKARTELQLGQQFDEKMDGLRRELQAASGPPGASSAQAQTLEHMVIQPDGETENRIQALEKSMAEFSTKLVGSEASAAGAAPAGASSTSADPADSPLASRLAKVEVELRELHQIVGSVTGGGVGVSAADGNEFHALAEKIQDMGQRVHVLEEQLHAPGVLTTEGAAPGGGAPGSGGAPASPASGGGAAGVSARGGAQAARGGSAAAGGSAGAVAGHADELDASGDPGKLSRSGPSERTMAELDRMTEARLTAMWTELAGHAEAAAVRADALERNLMSRLGKIEKNMLSSPSESKRKKKQREEEEKGMASKFKDDSELLKSFEWLNWRISWLEWRTDGEKRSFARPLDAKAILPSPPPQTIAAPCFSQPITEDVELWTRDRTRPSVPQRLRRVPAQPGAFGQPGPQADTLGVVRPTQSTGTLPRLPS